MSLTPSPIPPSEEPQIVETSASSALGSSAVRRGFRAGRLSCSTQNYNDRQAVAHEPGRRR